MRTFKGFIIKCVLFLVPFFVLAGIYFYDDPFKVLREYKKYDNDPIFLNEDYIGWKTYKNYPGLPALRFLHPRKFLHHGISNL